MQLTFGGFCIITSIYNDSNRRFNTTVAEISRLAASGMTKEVGASITSSDTIIFLRTGKQCMKNALSVHDICSVSTVQLISLLSTLP